MDEALIQDDGVDLIVEELDVGRLRKTKTVRPK